MTDVVVREAPARVNLIGEHTDYTGGYVMPMAIPFQTTARVSAHAGSYVFESEMFTTGRTMSTEDRGGKTGDWSDYPVGVLRELQAAGVMPRPFVLRLEGNVPLGSGLSSSASVEVATALALLKFCGVTMPAAEIALLCQRAENRYVGSPCGIMDQFVVTAAERGQALLLNTRDLSYELLPMTRGGLAECVVVVANSMVRHSVATGEYGVRRRELESGQTLLVESFGVRDLGDATMEQLTGLEGMMSAESFRRCRHVISENGRVMQAKEAMLAGDPVALGAVMTRAHVSERDDFQCSVEEIDFLVAKAVEMPGCYGARLTGGGFGGCTVNLVRTGDVESFVEGLRGAYAARFGLAAEIHICDAVEGAVARAGN